MPNISPDVTKELENFVYSKRRGFILVKQQKYFSDYVVAEKKESNSSELLNDLIAALPTDEASFCLIYVDVQSESGVVPVKAIVVCYLESSSAGSKTNLGQTVAYIEKGVVLNWPRVMVYEPSELNAAALLKAKIEFDKKRQH